MSRALVGLGLAAAAGCGDATGTPPVVPRAPGPVKLDGDWNVAEGWPNAALRYQFYGNDGKLSRPSSEIRLLQDEQNVYVGLYAADDDLESDTDAFDLVVGSVALHVGVTGRFAPAWPGVRVAVDADGTMNDKRDRDEEWKLEIAIPRALLPRGTTLVVVSRCDTPVKTTDELCGAWWGPVTL